MSKISQYLLKALHVFQIRTLQSFGFGTRVTLSNKSHTQAGLATDYRIDLTIYSPDGLSNTYQEGIAQLPIDAAIHLDCAKWQTCPGKDQIMIFHLIPLRLMSAADESGELSLDRAEIWGLFTAQDHYVEYYRDDGFSSGVLYQSGAFNYQKFSRETTTVIQAPKIFLSITLDTILSVMHTSFEPNYQREAALSCVLLDEKGHSIAKWKNLISPFTAQAISMKERLQYHGVSLSGSDDIRCLTLLGLCKNAALLPLILNMDSHKGTLAVEHSLPPMYYGQSVTGPIRAKMIMDLQNSGFFLE